MRECGSRRTVYAVLRSGAGQRGCYSPRRRLHSAPYALHTRPVNAFLPAARPVAGAHRRKMLPRQGMREWCHPWHLFDRGLERWFRDVGHADGGLLLVLRHASGTSCGGLRNGAVTLRVFWSATFRPGLELLQQLTTASNRARLNDIDKRHAIVLALQAWPDRSQNQIAEQVGCSQRYVSMIRDEVRTTSNLPSHVTGKDGKRYPARRARRRRPSRFPDASSSGLKVVQNSAQPCLYRPGLVAPWPSPQSAVPIATRVLRARRAPDSAIGRAYEQVQPLVVRLPAVQVPSVVSDLMQTTLPVPSLAIDEIAVSPCRVIDVADRIACTVSKLTVSLISARDAAPSWVCPSL